MGGMGSLTLYRPEWLAYLYLAEDRRPNHLNASLSLNVPEQWLSNALSRSKNAEFIALGVGQNNPSLSSLAYICVSRAESDKAFDLGILVVRPQVEMESVLARLGLRYRNE